MHWLDLDKNGPLTLANVTLTGNTNDYDATKSDGGAERDAGILLCRRATHRAPRDHEHSVLRPRRSSGQHQRRDQFKRHGGGGRQYYLPYGGPRGDAVALPTDRAFTGQVRDATGLDYFRARYFSSVLGRFISADSIVPGAGNPQNLNRYAFVLGNPLKYTDPTGHSPCHGHGKCGSGGGPSVRPSTPKTGKSPTFGSGEESRTIGSALKGGSGASGNTIEVDTQAWAKQAFPTLSPASLRQVATQLDAVALGADLLAETIVAGHAAVGFVGISFEGTPVAGPAGAYAGWILGELNPATRTLLNAGNVLATFATGASTLADMKAGDTRLYGSMSMSTTGLAVDYHLTVSTSTYLAVTTTTVGWAAQVVEMSLGVQAIALANDLGMIPTWRPSIHGRLKLP